MQVFGAPLSGGRRAVSLVNKQPLGSPANMTLFWSKIGYPDSLQVTVEDAFSGSMLSTSAEHNMTFTVAPDDTVLVVLQPLQDQLCSSDAHLGLRESEQVLGQGTLRTTRGSTELQGDEAGQGCVSLNALDVWRPWHHGFFEMGADASGPSL